jgi:hypothetical protein
MTNESDISESEKQELRAIGQEMLKRGKGTEKLTQWLPSSCAQVLPPASTAWTNS